MKSWSLGWRYTTNLFWPLNSIVTIGLLAYSYDCTLITSLIHWNWLQPCTYARDQPFLWGWGGAMAAAWKSKDPYACCNISTNYRTASSRTKLRKTKRERGWRRKSLGSSSDWRKRLYVRQPPVLHGATSTGITIYVPLGKRRSLSSSQSRLTTPSPSLLSSDCIPLLTDVTRL